MIKINLIREARSGARDLAGTSRTATSRAPSMSAAPRELNNILLVGLILTGLLVSGGYWFFKSRELSSKQEEAVARRAEAQQLEAIIAEVEQLQRRRDALKRRIDLINDL